MMFETSKKYAIVTTDLAYDVTITPMATLDEAREESLRMLLTREFFEITIVKTMGGWSLDEISGKYRLQTVKDERRKT